MVVETRRRFVGEDHCGTMNERPGDANALLFTTRQFVREAIGQRADTKAVEQPFGLDLCLHLAHAGDRCHQENVLARRQSAQKIRALEYRTDRLCAERPQRSRCCPINAHAVGLDLPAIGLQQAGGDTEQGGLARAARTDDEDQFSGSDRERHLVQHTQRAPGCPAMLGHALKADFAHARNASSGSMFFNRTRGTKAAKKPDAASSVATATRSASA